jgi:hypothetical protein
MGYRVDLEIDFPLRLPAVFDAGRAQAIIQEWTNQVMDIIASKGLSEVHQWMNVYFKNPTPYYETQVTVDRAGADRVIHDRGIIYGPWLDGSGSRNSPVTRFPGYPHWRRTRQYLQETEAPRVLMAREPDLTRLLESL